MNLWGGMGVCVHTYLFLFCKYTASGTFTHLGTSFNIRYTGVELIIKQVQQTCYRKHSHQ